MYNVYIDLRIYEINYYTNSTSTTRLLSYNYGDREGTCKMN